MNIKGLLFGSVAAGLAVSSAQAADAIIIAEPEPVEYVRVCDIYGAGYFYLPGTETCLKIGGYLRYQMEYIKSKGTSSTVRKYARFAPSFTASSETDWGTLTAFGQVFFNWYSDESTVVWAEHAYISLSNGTNSLLIGKTDTPFYEFLGYWAGPTIHEGGYGGDNLGQIRYTHDAGNGFKFTAAVVESDGSDFDPSVEAGVSFEQDWGWVAGAVAYDTHADQLGARIGVGVNFTPAISASLHVMYADDDVDGLYSLNDGWWVGGNQAEWAALVGVTAGVTDTVALNGHFQWYDTDEWTAAINAAWTPVENLTITPEIAYESVTESAIGFLRFQRNF